jgi:hypothetical protein
MDNLEKIKDAIRAVKAEALGENRPDLNRKLLDNMVVAYQELSHADLSANNDSTIRMLHVLILNKGVGQHQSLLSVTDVSSVGGRIARAERLMPLIGPYYSDQLSRHAAGVAINAASDDHIVGHLAHGALAVKLSVPN